MKRNIPGRPYRRMIVSLCWMATTIGCAKEPFRYVPVSGDVKYEDGTNIPGAGIQLVFYPQVAPVDDKTHAKQGRAVVESDGRYEGVTSHKYQDGLIRGKHKVVIRPADGAESLVPPEYRDVATTPLVLDTDDPASYLLRITKP